MGQDLATGICGLPHRLGAKATALTAARILLTASVLTLFGPGGQSGRSRQAAFFAAVLMAATAAATADRNPSSRRFFLATIPTAVVDLAFFTLSRTRL